MKFDSSEDFSLHIAMGGMLAGLFIAGFVYAAWSDNDTEVDAYEVVPASAFEITSENGDQIGLRLDERTTASFPGEQGCDVRVRDADGEERQAERDCAAFGIDTSQFLGDRSRNDLSCNQFHCVAGIDHTSIMARICDVDDVSRCTLQTSRPSRHQRYCWCKHLGIEVSSEH